MKARVPGELMQMDSMSLSFSEGKTLKEFKATCPVSKWSGMRVYSRATSGKAGAVSGSLDSGRWWFGVSG